VKYKPSRDIPQAVRELKDLSPSKIVLWVLNKRNEERTPESVTMWFKQHPEIYDELSKEIVQGLPTEKQATDATMFQNGNFEELASVKEWILFMGTRRRKGKSLHPNYVKEQVRSLRWCCERFHKHPDRLSFHDAQEIFQALEHDPDHSHWEGGAKVVGMDTNGIRRGLKDFLKSKGSSDFGKIGVGKPSGFGHYKTLHVEKSTVHEILGWIKTQNFMFYVADKLMFHNGIRLNAMLTARIENFKQGASWSEITVLEKFREEKTFILTPEVGQLICQVIGERKEGLIFQGLEKQALNRVNREALRKFVPELEPKIEMPSHCFRHFCAQTLLRATGWNSDAVASIMQCTKQSLEESYGGAPQGKQREWCELYLPMLGVEVKA